METIFHQLGELLLASIPTIVCLLVVVGLYRTLVYRPLKRVLSERYQRTEGAMAQAKADIAAAEARTGEYEERIRAARSEVFRALEHRRELAVKERYSAAAEARSRAEQLISAERSSLEKQSAAARAGLQQQAEQLAGEIIHAVLHEAAAGARP